ncbi:MAG TPA: sodium/proton-translocating pyrophosphatase, partial [bacterium]|nr:sodium/proton-translocating pyrophosphatase [bacterium]
MDLGQYKQIAIIGVPFFGVLALLFAAYKAAWVSKKDAGSAEMQQISGFIQEGAMAFLKREYSTLSIFVVCVAALLLALGIRQDAPFTAAAFLYGAF